MLLIGAMPMGKILLGDAIHDLDAQLVDDRASATFNVKKGTDEAANIGRNLHDAIDVLDFSKPLNGHLSLGFVVVRHVKSSLILDILLNHAQCSQLGGIILTNKAQDGNSICLEEKRLQIGSLKFAVEPGSDKILRKKSMESMPKMRENRSSIILGEVMKQVCKMFAAWVDLIAAG